MDNKTLNGRNSMRTVTAELSAEQDFIVPDTKPDIKKILKLTAVPILHQSDCGQGRLNVSGDILLYVCYLPEEGTTARAMELRLPFSDVLELGTCDTCIPEITVRRATASLINGRKINIRVTLTLTCTVATSQEITYLCPDEDENIRMLKTSVSFCESVVVPDRTVEFSEHLELPAHSAPVRELLSVDPSITIQEYQVLSGRIVVSGMVQIETLYLPDTDPCRIARMEHELPFTEILEAEGLEEGAYCQLSVLPCRFEVGLYEDADGDARLVGIRFSFRLSADACNTVSHDAVTDAFGIYAPLDMQTETVSGICAYKQETMREPIREILPIQNVLEVCSIHASARHIETVAEETGMRHNGELAVSALVLCEPNGEPECMNTVLPFTVLQKTDETCTSENLLVHASCEHVGYTLQPNGGLELRTAVKLESTLICCTQTDVLTQWNVTEQQKPSECRMTVYFTQEGDCLWNVAKRYHRCPHKIAALNELEGETLKPNQAILIP